MTSYISPSITDPALRDTLQSIADDVEASGITISDVDPDASLIARSGRLWYNATSSNLFIFSDTQGGYVRATGEEQSYHAVRIYWPNSASVYPASPPQVTLTWANLTAASAGARYTGGLTLPTVSGTAWQEDPPNTLSTGQTNIWWSDVIFQRIGGSDTTVSTGTTPQKHTNFNGIVTFTNNSGSDINTQVGLLNLFDAGDVENAIANNVTTIDGGKITTGTLNANTVNVRNLNTETLLNNAVTHSAGGAGSLSSLSGSISITVPVKRNYVASIHMVATMVVLGVVGSGGSGGLSLQTSIGSHVANVITFSNTATMLGPNTFSQFQSMMIIGSDGTTPVTCSITASNPSNISNPSAIGQILAFVSYK